MVARRMGHRSRPVPIGDAIARNVRDAREASELTQDEVAEEMQELGFTSWTRVTVAEVEGSGRGRRVGVDELLGLAAVFELPLIELLGPPERNGSVLVAEGTTAGTDELQQLMQTGRLRGIDPAGIQHLRAERSLITSELETTRHIMGVREAELAAVDQQIEVLMSKFDLDDEQ